MLNRLLPSSKKVREELRMDVLFILPQFVLYFVFTLLPLFIAVPLVFTNKMTVDDTEFVFVGLENFKSIFQGGLGTLFTESVWRTVRFTLLNYMMVYLFGMTLALVMYETKLKVKNLFFVIVFLPWIISGLGIGMLLLMLFSPDFGDINLLLKELGILTTPIDIKSEATTTWALPLAVGWRAAGFNMALFLSGLLSIPDDTIDASKIDGCSYWQRFSKIYLPQMVPSIIIATTFCLIGSFGLVDETIGLGGNAANESARFFSIVLIGALSSSSGASNAGFSQGIAMSFTVYLPLLILAYLLRKLQHKLQY